MSFAQPFLLFGLLGASIPILIHLIHRQRPRRQPFPALELLMASVRRAERQWRLRRFMLLAARVTLLAAFALAAARPFWGPSAPAGTRAATGPEDVAFVIDVSASMRAELRGRSSLSRALAEARERVDRLGPDSRAVIVAAEAEPRAMVDKLTGDRGALMGALRKIEVSWATSSLAESVTAAAALLDNGEEASKDRGRRILIFSDLARSAVDGAADLDLDPAPELEVVDLDVPAPDEARANAGFVGVPRSSVPGEAPRTVEMMARVQSYAPVSLVEDRRTSDRDVDLRCDEKEGPLVRTFLELTAGALTQKSIRHGFDRTGVHLCRLELSPDRLVADDVHYVRLFLQKQVRLLIINGDPSGIAKEDETFYLERAWEAGSADQAAARIVSADDLASVDFGSFDVVILAGVPGLNRTQGDRLHRFVEEGGGLWITASEALDPEAYAAALDAVLPRPFRGMKASDDRQRRGLGFTAPKEAHPILDLFAAEGLSGLLSTRTMGFALLQPTADRPMRTLLSYTNGAPALVVRSVGRGRVAVLTTSIDRDLTDLPIQPAFVPLVRQIVLWLGHALSTDSTEPALVGQPVHLKLPDGLTGLEVVLPSGRRTGFGLSEFEGRETIDVVETHEPGHYRVRIERGGEMEEVPELGFVVNLDPSESDLRAVPAPEAVAVLRGESAPAIAGGGVLGIAASARSAAASQDRWTGALLLIMFMAFVLESLLTSLRWGR